MIPRKYALIAKSMMAKKDHGFTINGKVQICNCFEHIKPAYWVGLFPNLSEKASLATFRVYNTLIIFNEKTHLQNKTSKQTGI